MSLLWKKYWEIYQNNSTTTLGDSKMGFLDKIFGDNSAETLPQPLLSDIKKILGESEFHDFVGLCDKYNFTKNIKGIIDHFTNFQPSLPEPEEFITPTLLGSLSSMCNHLVGKGVAEQNKQYLHDSMIITKVVLGIEPQQFMIRGCLITYYLVFGEIAKAKEEAQLGLESIKKLNNPEYIYIPQSKHTFSFFKFSDVYKSRYKKITLESFGGNFSDMNEYFQQILNQ